MVRFLASFAVFFLVISTSSFAVSDLKAVSPTHTYTTPPSTKCESPASDCDANGQTGNNYYNSGLYSATLYTGSLKNNVTRIAAQYGWNQVVWDVPHDYVWTGNTRVTAPTLPLLFSKFLAKYPLQAVFYHGNHVLLIQQRTLR